MSYVTVSPVATYNVQTREHNSIPVQEIADFAYAIKVTVDGDVTYVGKAVPGSAQADAVWQCMKIDESSGTVVTWADGDSAFDNVASDLTSLSYS